MSLAIITYAQALNRADRLARAIDVLSYGAPGVTESGQVAAPMTDAVTRLVFRMELSTGLR